MFEKYNEIARRVIFNARYEVSRLSASAIETEHLLLGLLRADRDLLLRFLPARMTNEEFRRQVEARATIGAKIETSVEVPLSRESKKALANVAEESDMLSSKYIGAEHLLLGLLRRQGSIAEQVLTDNGMSLSQVRQALRDEADK